MRSKVRLQGRTFRGHLEQPRGSFNLGYLTSDPCHRFPNPCSSHILVIPMLKKDRLFTPGPTPLLPQAQTAIASYGAHHRTADFRALFTRVLADIKEFIGTNNDVLVLTSSGTC